MVAIMSPRWRCCFVAGWLLLALVLLNFETEFRGADSSSQSTITQSQTPQWKLKASPLSSPPELGKALLALAGCESCVDSSELFTLEIGGASHKAGMDVSLVNVNQPEIEAQARAMLSTAARYLFVLRDPRSSIFEACQDPGAWQISCDHAEKFLEQHVRAVARWSDLRFRLFSALDSLDTNRSTLVFYEDLRRPTWTVPLKRILGSGEVSWSQPSSCPRVRPFVARKVNEILAEELSPQLWKKWATMCLPPWAKAVPNPTQGIMHTFFQPTLAVERSGTGTLEAWRDLWQAAGFQVRVLTLEDAKAAPDFEEFSRRVRNNVPLGRNPEYEYFCYARYVAMAQVGGGFMSDYDTAPAHLLPDVELPHGGRFTVFEGFVPALMSGTQEEWRRMAKRLLETGEVQGEKYAFKDGAKILFSDMFAMKVLQESGAKDEHFNSEHLVPGANKIFGDLENCEAQRRLILGVHFSHEALTRLGLRIQHRGEAMRNLTASWQRCQKKQSWRS